MINRTELVRRDEGEKLGALVYDRDIRHIVRQTEGRDYITIYTRVSNEPEMVDYVDPEIMEYSNRLCDMFSVQRIYHTGEVEEVGIYPLPVNEQGKALP